MTKETMTVHKALAELKILDDRIGNAIDSTNFCVANKHYNRMLYGVSIDDYTKMMRAGYDKASDLIKRRIALRRAVMISNATTEVDINGTKYTVAEAIEMKNHGMENYRHLHDNIKRQYALAQKTINSENDKLADKADAYVMGLYNQKEGKVGTTEVGKVRQDWIENNTYEMIDPIGVAKVIEDLENKISNFEAEVDAALSCSNALTEITIEY